MAKIVESMHAQQSQLDRLRHTTASILDNAECQRGLTLECIASQATMHTALAAVHADVAGVRASALKNQQYITTAIQTVINQLISSKAPKVPFLFVIVPDGRGKRIFTAPKKWGNKEYRMHLLCNGRDAHNDMPKVDPHFLFDSWDQIKPKTGPFRGYSLLEPKAFIKRFGPYIKFVLGAMMTVVAGAATFAFLPSAVGLVPGLRILFDSGGGSTGEFAEEQLMDQLADVCAKMVERVDQEGASARGDKPANRRYTNRDGSLDVTAAQDWRCPEAT